VTGARLMLLILAVRRCLFCCENVFDDEDFLSMKKINIK